jgi:hypothetical protein
MHLTNFARVEATNFGTKNAVTTGRILADHLLEDPQQRVPFRPNHRTQPRIMRYLKLVNGNAPVKALSTD